MALNANNFILELQNYLLSGLRSQRSPGKNSKRYWRSCNVLTPCQTNPERIKVIIHIRVARSTIHKKRRSQIRSGRLEKRQWKGPREPFPVLTDAIRIAQGATEEDALLADDRLAIQSSCQALSVSQTAYPWNREGLDSPAPMVIHYGGFIDQMVAPLYSSPRDDCSEELVRQMAALQLSSPSNDIPEPQFIHLRRRLPWYKTFFPPRQVREIEDAFAKISSKRDQYKRQQLRKRHREVIAIQYLEAVNDPTTDEDELRIRMADLSCTFYPRPEIEWPGIDWTSNITPTRIPANAKCPHRPQAPEHLMAAKVPLHKRYKPKTPLLKTVLCQNMRNSLVDGFRELRDRQAAAKAAKVEPIDVETIEAVEADLR